MAEADSTTLPTPIPTSLNISELARIHRVSRRTIARRLAKGWAPPARKAALSRPAAPTPAHAAHSRHGRIITAAALVSAVSLAAVSGFFGIVGMTRIFVAAALPIMVMVGALEAAKLVTCAWLARHWSVAPLLLRAPLTVMVLALMTLTAIGNYGFLTRAHLQHQVTAQEAVDRNAAPIAQRIALAQATVTDLDGQIARLDAMVKTATGKGWTRTAMALVGRQRAARAGLVAERQQAAEHLADLKVQEANVDAQRARVTAEAGPALYLAKLFNVGDPEAMVRLITALLVLVLDPLAVLLTLAAARHQ
jgi:hypothetical protein